MLKPFYEGKFDPLSDKEKRLLSAFSDKRGKFYIIGTFGKKNEKVLKHEIAHGMFFVDIEYRKEVVEVLNEMSPDYRSKFEKYLAKSGGYHPDVYEDEIHAYVLTGKLKQKEIREKLEEIYERHLN